MTKQQPSTIKEAPEESGGLSPEEMAVIGGVRRPILRAAFTALWQLKLRLQFTGWLQYLPTGIAALLLLLLAGFTGWLGAGGAARVLTLLAAVSSALFVFDLVTVKFRLRPHEPLPERNDDLNPFDLMRARHSCRSFQTRPLRQADRDELLAAVRRRCEEGTIGDAPIRIEYIAASLNVWPTVNASEFLVAIAPAEYNRLAVIDVGRTLQKIVTDATRMGIATCWIGPGADQTSVAHHLAGRFHPDRDHLICVCAVGYESAYLPIFLRIFNAQFRRRLPLSRLFFSDTSMSQPLNVKSPPYSRLGRCYEVCQWAPSSYNGQTTRCMVGVDDDHDPPRLTRFDFYAVTESRYYAVVAVGIWCANWEMGCGAVGVDGGFAVLPPEERGIEPVSQMSGEPRYDVSWKLADPMPLPS